MSAREDSGTCFGGAVAAQMPGGTSISYVDEGIDNELYVALGFLEHPERFPPEAHADWCEKLPWIEFADGLPRIDGYSRKRNSAFGTPKQRR
jgi:hypothetical protein